MECTYYDIAWLPWQAPTFYIRRCRGVEYDLKAQAFSNLMEDFVLFLFEFGETAADTRPILKRYEDGSE
jgi:hypothetical protein